MPAIYSLKDMSFKLSKSMDKNMSLGGGYNRSHFLARMIFLTSIPRIGRFIFCLMLFGAAAQASFANPIQDENAKIGNPDWEYVAWAENNQIEGYASPVSVNSNNTVKIYVNSVVDSTYTLTIYRLGWYNGAGARMMTSPITRTSIKQVLPTPNAKTGLIEANWKTPYSLTIPANWVSGVYIARVVGNQSGFGRFIPFVVRNDARVSDYLFQNAVTTWQAYNAWGGNSLYISNSPNGPARKVSFHRPYQRGNGMGDLYNWELSMIRFLERTGYDVTYQTDIDTHRGNGGLLSHKALLSVGHDEYWTKAMRDNVENARSHGLGLGFFGSNICYWQIRLESSSTGLANNTIVAYKDFAPTEDPYALDLNLANDNLITTRWRQAPVNRPENSLVGVMYTKDPVNADIVISDASNWIFTGTSLQNGDPLIGLLGYEIDSYVNNGKAPVNTSVVAHSPVPGDPTSFGDMSVYTMNCTLLPCINPTSTVFAAGSMQWNWGLDNWGGHNLDQDAAGHDSPAKQITRNVLARLIGAPL